MSDEKCIDSNWVIKLVGLIKGYVKDSTSNKLDLSGGTIASDNYAPLIIKRNNTYVAGLKFENNNGILGSIGMDVVDGDLMKLDSTSKKFYTILDIDNVCKNGIGRTYFNGIINTNGLINVDTNINNCVSADAIFTVPETGIYLFLGIVGETTRTLRLFYDFSNYRNLVDTTSLQSGMTFPFCRGISCAKDQKIIIGTKETTATNRAYPGWVSISIIRIR